MSRATLGMWWSDCLNRGWVCQPQAWPEEPVEKRLVYASFFDSYEVAGTTEPSLAGFLARECPRPEFGSCRVKGVRCFVFPPLEKCRQEWELNRAADRACIRGAEAFKRLNIQEVDVRAWYRARGGVPVGLYRQRDFFSGGLEAALYSRSLQRRVRQILQRLGGITLSYTRNHPALGEAGVQVQRTLEIEI